MIVHVRIIEANEIPKNMLAKPNAFCLVSLLGRRVAPTHVIKSSINPIWNEEFHFPVANPNGDVLRIVVKHKSSITVDTMLANLNIKINQIPFNKVVDHWFDLHKPYCKETGGKIHLMLHVAPPNLSAFASEHSSEFGFEEFSDDDQLTTGLCSSCVESIPIAPQTSPFNGRYDPSKPRAFPDYPQMPAPKPVFYYPPQQFWPQNGQTLIPPPAEYNVQTSQLPTNYNQSVIPPPPEYGVSPQAQSQRLFSPNYPNV